MNRPSQPNPDASAERGDRTDRGDHTDRGESADRDNSAERSNPFESANPERAESSSGDTAGHAGQPEQRRDASDPDQPSERADTSAGDNPPKAEPETRDDEMERLRREVDQANKHALQAQAEAENFRKRMRRDLEEQLRFAAVPLVSDLLQVRDNLYRALEAATANGGGTSDGLRDGVAMCAKQLDDVLAKHGVREIPAENETFDPNVHEAISQLPSETHAAGTVVHVAVAGFRLHERVIRPSQVVVSSGSAADNSDS